MATLVANFMEAGDTGVAHSLIEAARADLKLIPDCEGDGSEIKFFLTYRSGYAFAVIHQKAMLEAHFETARRHAQEHIARPLTSAMTVEDALMQLIGMTLSFGEPNEENAGAVATYAWLVVTTTRKFGERFGGATKRYASIGVFHGKIAMAFGDTEDEIAEALATQRVGHRLFGASPVKGETVQ